MNIEQQMTKVKNSLEGKSFDELAAHFEEWDASGHYNVTIDSMLMDLMEVADEERFIEWASNY